MFCVDLFLFWQFDFTLPTLLQQKSIVKTMSVVMPPQKYTVTEVTWSCGVFSAAQTLLNDPSIRGMLQAVMCLYDPLTLPQLHISTCHFDRESDSIL